MNYSDINISRSIGGMGTGGLCTASLSFTIPKEDYGVFRPAKKAPMTTILIYKQDGTIIETPTFYVDSRMCSSGKIKFTCYDRMAFADGIYFYESDLENVPEFASAIAEKTSKNDIPYISPLIMVNVIARKMGISYGGGLDLTLIKNIDVESLPGTSCSEWLEKFAAAECGFFYISNSDVLRFSRFNAECGYVNITNDYTKPDIGDTLIISEIIVSGDSGKRYEYIYEDDPGGLTLNINGGSLVNRSTSESLARMILGTTYTYWSVEKAVINNIPLVNSRCSLYSSIDETPPVYCLANNISLSIKESGIIASLSANSAGGGEIGQMNGRISRQLENAVKLNEKLGKHLVMTRYQGIHWEDDEEGDE